MKESKKRYRADPVKYQRELAGRRMFRVLNPEKAKQQDRKGNLKTIFGISVEDYDRLFEFQNGLCAICGKPESAILFGKPKRLAIDHDHDSGQVRGLLCSRCNTAIGLMNDDVDILEKAQDYLLSPIAFPLTAESKQTR